MAKGKVGKKIGLSVVMPSYNAQDFIYKNLIDLHNVLGGLKENFEIICVVDGATDKTLSFANKAAKRYEEIKVGGYEKNHGKGYAVRFGMKKAKGDIVGFVDAGCDLDYGYFLGFLDIMKEEKADIVIGSKRHPRSIVNYPTFRKIYSFGYQLYIKALFGLDINDTQVGMKIFKKGIIGKIMPLLSVDGFAFDIEMLAVSQKLIGAKIIEAPIHVNLDENSSTIKIKGGFFINSLRVFWDTLKIFYKLSVLGYYRKKLSKK